MEVLEYYERVYLLKNDRNSEIKTVYKRHDSQAIRTETHYTMDMG